jgi:protein-disulfide isomerase
MQNNDQKSIVSAIIIAGVLIAGAVLLKGNNPPAVNVPAANAPVVNNVNNTASQGRPVTPADHILGNINAKIVIVEYSDLECPFCKSFHATMHKVLQNSNGNVAWVFRSYPIPQLHPKSFHEHEAAECAFDQGGNDAFWKYVDRIFEITPSNNGLDVAELPKVAQYIGLNLASFNTCLESGKFSNKVQADINDGAKAGVNGTPSSFILQNGNRVDNIPGAQPYESVMQRLSAIK